MQKRALLWSASLALVVVWAGCDAVAYEPSGENVVDVDPTARPLDIDLGVAPDTLALWGGVTLRPGFGGRAAQRVEVLLGDQVVATSADPSRVEVPTTEIADGTYALRVRAYAASGTGSLAEAYGREEVVAEVTRVAVVDNAPPTPVTVTSLAPEAGRLVVRWERYRRRNFQQYRVYRVDGTRRTLVATADQPDQTSYADPSFVAGVARYAVEVRAADQSVVGPVAARTFEAPAVVEAERTGDGGLRVRWEQTPFFQAFGSYELQRTGQIDPLTTVARITSPGDTMAVDRLVNGSFGTTYTYRVVLTGAGGASYLGEPLEASPDPSAPVGRVVGFDGGHMVGLSDDGLTLVRLDGRTLERTGEIPLGGYAEVTVGSGLALAVGAGPFGRAPVSRLVDLASFQTTASFQTEDALGRHEYPGSRSRPDGAALTAGGVLVSSYLAYYSPAVYGGLGVIALDARRGQVVGRVDAPGRRPPSFDVSYRPIDLVTASPDGRYAVLYEEQTGEYVLYERPTGAGFQRLGVVGSRFDLTDAAFVGDRQLAVAVPGRQQVQVLSVPSLGVATAFPTAAVTRVSYDPGSGLLLGISTSNTTFCFGYDPSTGARAFSVRAAGPVELHGGVLWSESRYRRVAPAL